MLQSIKSFFTSSMSPAPTAEEGEAKKDIRLAACALLLELAHADEEFTDDERQHLESAVRRQFGLDASEAEKLLELAEEERAQAEKTLTCFGARISQSALGGALARPRPPGREHEKKTPVPQDLKILEYHCHKPSKLWNMTVL
jgi:hypothetical protein